MNHFVAQIAGMSTETSIWIGAIVAFHVLMLVTAIACYRKVPQGKALIRSGCCGRRVSLNGMLVCPLLHSGSFADITSKSLEFEFRDYRALKSEDGQLVELRAVFRISAKQSAETVLKAFDIFGVEGMSDIERLREQFGSRFEEAVVKMVAFHQRDELFSYDTRAAVCDELKKSIGDDLDGYVIEDIAIEYFEPVEESQLADEEEDDTNREAIS